MSAGGGAQRATKLGVWPDELRPLLFGLELAPMGMGKEPGNFTQDVQVQLGRGVWVNKYSADPRCRTVRVQTVLALQSDRPLPCAFWTCSF